LAKSPHAANESSEDSEEETQNPVEPNQLLAPPVIGKSMSTRLPRLEED